MLATLAGSLYVGLLITDERRDDEFVEDVIAAGLEGAMVWSDNPSSEGRA
jgi:hypothetical protein